MKIKVNGKEYGLTHDFIMRATFATSDTGDRRRISTCGYISNEITVRRAIRRAFNLEGGTKK